MVYGLVWLAKFIDVVPVIGEVGQIWLDLKEIKDFSMLKVNNNYYKKKEEVLYYNLTNKWMSINYERRYQRIRFLINGNNTKIGFKEKVYYRIGQTKKD